MKPRNTYELLTQRVKELEKGLFLAELALHKVEEYPGVSSDSNAPNWHIAYYQTEIVIIECLQV